MKAILTFALSISAAAILSPCSAFSARSKTAVISRPGVVPCHAKPDGHDDCDTPRPLALTRRSAISTTFALLPLGILSSSSAPLPAGAAEDKGKVVVLGGAGWVGAHVANDLDKKGYHVVSISRSSPEAQVERTKSILGATIPSAEYVSLDAGAASVEDLSSAMRDALAVISCAGVAPGSPNQRDGNGLVNARIAKAAKSAGVPKFVYIGVASSLANGPAKFLLGDYFKGKEEAEKSVVKEFGDQSFIVKPAIVAGGTPGEIRPPGPPGVKPVNVDALAKVVVAGALGELKGRIDGNDDITALGS